MLRVCIVQDLIFNLNTMAKMLKYLGFLTPENEKTEPKSNACFICLGQIKKDGKNTTHSLVCENGEHVTYFFRTHKQCWEHTPGHLKRMYESNLVDSITKKL